MRDEIFSEAWASAWATALNNNAAYKKAAKSWEWPVGLVIEDYPANNKPEERCLYLDLWHGQCRSATPAIRAELENAEYIITASWAVWEQVLAGKTDPMMALMRGKLKLAKGKMFKLARYGNAAKELVKSAREAPSDLLGQQTGSRDKVQANGSSVPVEAAQKAMFVTTGPEGLNMDSFPMRLYQKAKKLGIWNPADIDLSQDKKDWKRLSALEKEVLIHLTSLFQAGEESVTRDILPLIMAIAREGRLEEEIYLTTFLWEEAKHTEFFSLFLTQVPSEDIGDLTRFHLPVYRKIFYDALPSAMNALLEDTSPAAQIRASVTYNMIVEGTLAETGYHAYYQMLADNDIMPGLRKGIGYLKQDESRHIAYGIYLLSRLLSENPHLWSVLESQMEQMLALALDNINELFEAYETLPFGLELSVFLEYATDQFQKRMDRIERAKDHPIGALAFSV